MKETVLKAAYPVAVRIPPTVGPAKVRKLNARMRVSKALRLIRQKEDFAKAEAVAQPLFGTPSEAGAWHVRAVLKQKQADLTGALEDIRKAGELDPKDLDIKLVHLQLAGQTQRTAEQREILEQLAARTPRHGGEVRKTLDALAESEDAELVARYDKVLQASSVSYEPERVRELEEQLRLIQLFRTDRKAYDEHVARITAERERPVHIVARALFTLQQWQELAAYLEENTAGTPSEDGRPLTLRQLRKAARKAQGSGHLAAAMSLAKRVLIDEPGDEKMNEMVASCSDQLAIVANGWPELAPAPEKTDHQPRKGAVLSVLAQSLPMTSGGYATRSHGILSSLHQRGWDVRAVTRLGFPFDWWRGIGERTVNRVDVVDEIEYHRLYDEGVTHYPKHPLEKFTERFTQGLVSLARDHGASLIHASSFYFNGLAGARAARQLGIPFIYEMRGLEDLMKVSRDEGFAETERYKFLTSIENAACRDADVVFVITEALRREMIDRGVPEERLRVLPNGVHASRFAPRERDTELAAQLGVTDKTVIGYAGGLVDYEGLDLLLQATAALKQKRSDFHVVIVGDGHHEHVLRGMADELRLGDVVTFTGRVPHAEVGRYISLFDIAPFPRLPLPVCELISPIKPFESMAMGKAVVSSSVAALTEIVDDGKTGLVFEKGSAEAFAAVLGKLLDSPELRAELGKAAREWVLAERDWAQITTIVDETYHELLDRKAGKAE
nr:MAG: glycosyltransferase WbuB [Thermocrispum agreste]